MKFKEQAIEMLNSGVKVIDIVRQIQEEGLSKKSYNTIYNNVRNWKLKLDLENKNPALLAECESVGIPIENVKHGWYKGKHWSIAFKADEDGPTFEQMLKDHVEAIRRKLRARMGDVSDEVR